MKKTLLTFLWVMSFIIVYAQNYPNIVNYNFNGTPTNGVKIKTNIPFVAATQMPTITIQGFNFASTEAIGLTITFYIYSGGTNFNDPANYFFYNPKVTSFGSYTPPVYLSNENGLVTILINDKPYYQRFTVSAYAQGMSETSTQYQGWTVVDETLSGTQSILIPYQGRMAGDVQLPGGGIITKDGSIGIGTVTPHEALSVNGTIRSKEVKVETANWPDYVFKPAYQLTSLSSVKAYIDQNQHLPEMPSEQDVAKNGVNLGDMDKLLLQKVEELTLYLINKDKEGKEQQNAIQFLQKQIDILNKRLETFDDKTAIIKDKL
jgi:hypothetical protein